MGVAPRGLGIIEYFGYNLVLLTIIEYFGYFGAFLVLLAVVTFDFASRVKGE